MHIITRKRIVGFASKHPEMEYNILVSILDNLIDEIGEDETHPLASLMETLGAIIENYEKNNIPEPIGNTAQILQFLMQEHGLVQSDLPEIGSQDVVAEILAGKRQLNVSQIEQLISRFNISPAAFFST